MYFTRDPVIETVITSREGYKLSVRNTKHLSQDPFMVEAIEVISLGNICFFRNCDHSKPFLVPAGDYEIMEVRDAKINLKAVGLDRGVKIAGGREALIKLTKSTPLPVVDEKPTVDSSEEVIAPSNPTKKDKKETKKDSFKGEKWKEKKKLSRRRNHKEMAEVTGASQEILDTVQEELWEESQEHEIIEQKKFSLLPPPAKLISEVISQTVVNPVVTSADLNESLQALVDESTEVIDALLSADDALHFPETEEDASPSTSFSIEEGSSVLFLPQEEE
ncbi:hypothetical protein C10C_0587 [Chlamydia serpentis]|uniref:Uncharacterized protein n=1 Tax=Chlamydia serpentis TaxID=1967782 RepID=A0A2R8FBD2_9CHLA|nr:hypothetical protein [Chlamydia serpentis]SPN73743.1 hypothetical protein C10C_0587 [Chlamydia serpentis]